MDTKWPKHLLTPPTLQAILGVVLLDKLLQPAGKGSALARPKTRSDIPVVHPYARGSLQRIPLEGGQGSFENLDEAFLEDRYAASSKAPIESRWKTWQRLCASRALDPLPLTQEVIFKVGALLKEGKYRSSAQYFSVAKQRHREAEYPWTDALDLAVQQAVRSISRGLGPSRPKKDLFVDRAGQDLPVRLVQAYDRLGVPREHRFAEPLPVVTVALWFLLRGIEIANVKCKDVSFVRNLRQVKLSLPVSKTDPSARGCTRVHSCICKPAHERSCRSTCSAEVMFTRLQTCSCLQGFHPLCPYHGALRMSVDLRLRKLWDPEFYFFTGSSEPPSKRQVARLAQVLAFCLHADASEDMLLAQLEDWAEHAFRVAGSQLMARSRIPLPTIQMLGRWGSMAVLRYVQEAILTQPEITASTVASHLLGNDSVEAGETLRDQVRKLVAECIQGHGVLVHNVRTRFAHKPCAGESEVPSDQWFSWCGKWRYGTSSCLRNSTLLPGFRYCTSCFPDEACLSAVSQQEQAPEQPGPVESEEPSDHDDAGPGSASSQGLGNWLWS